MCAAVHFTCSLPRSRLQPRLLPQLLHGLLPALLARNLAREERLCVRGGHKLRLGRATPPLAPGTGSCQALQPAVALSVVVLLLGPEPPSLPGVKCLRLLVGATHTTRTRAG